MTTRVIGTVAIGLWVVSAIGFGILFTQGQTASIADGRTAILLTETEKEAILIEMRHMLETVHGVTDALARDDIPAAAAAAARSGTAVAADMSPALMTKLPLDFKKLGMSVHMRFDALAKSAQTGAGKEQLLKGLAEQMSSCVTCHATYALRIGQ